jgi:hypothetical protein
MGFNIAQQYGAEAPSLGGRGAYGIAPMAGSSNLYGAAIPMSGKYAGTLEDAIAWSLTPEGMQQKINMGLAAYKQMGDEQMKYRMLNEGIRNLGEMARYASGGYRDPYAMAELVRGAGDAYARGAEASRGLTQLGAGLPAVRYF